MSMAQVLEESALLNSRLLATDEDQYDKIALALAARLNKLPVQDLEAAQKDLDTISVTAHTIVYTYLLVAIIDATAGPVKAPAKQISAAAVPEGRLWPSIVQLLLEFDPVQARFCGVALLRMVDVVAAGAEQTANYVPAIQLLRHVILRLDETSSTLTSTHRTFIRLCLLSQAYSEAADILDRPIYNIPTTQVTYKHLCSVADQNGTYLSPVTGLTQPISSRIYLEYYLLGGMCYMALRRFREALVFLEIVISAPTLHNVTSAIMIEAYKKWLLVAVSTTGVAPAIPSGLSSAAVRNIRAIAKPYESVAEAFKSGDIDRLRAEIETGTAVWQEDGNYGLIVEVYEAFRKFAVLNVGKTFRALSVAQIAERTSPETFTVDETRTYLDQLIANNELQAVIPPSDDPAHQILRFATRPVSLESERQVEEKLASQTRELQTLLKHIQDTEHRMELSREYIEYLKKLKRIKEDEKKNGGAANGRPGMMEEDLDEDMMEGF